MTTTDFNRTRAENPMPERHVPKHDWTNFWDQVDRGNQSPWTTSCPTEDKATFERKVKRMIRGCVPEHLERLTELSGKCTWHWTAPAAGDQPGGTVSLERAILVASYVKEKLDVREVLAQLPGQVYRHPRVRNGVVTAPRPDVKLPFPEENLRSFLDELKYLALVAFSHFARHHRRFLRSLLPDVEATVYDEVFEIAVREILAVLHSTRGTDHAPSPLGDE